MPAYIYIYIKWWYIDCMYIITHDAVTYTYTDEPNNTDCQGQ
jgi:hypothetical protein